MIKRVFRISLLILIFILVAGVSTFFTLTFLIKGSDKVVVPNVEGKHIVPVLEILSNLALNTKVSRSEYSQEVPLHHVIYQDPRPGTQVKEGRDVRVVLSMGTQQLTLPNLKGLSRHQAEIILEEKGLCKGRIAETFSVQFQNNTIIAQSPGAGASIERSRCIDLLVSKGERPNADAMPDLTGISVEEAVSIIEKSHLRIGRISGRADAAFPPNAVISQQPPPFHRVEENSIVHLMINRQLSADGTDKIHSKKLSLFQYRLETGFLKRHVRVRLASYGTTMDLYDDFLKAGEEIWFLIPETGDSSLSLYVDDVLVSTRSY